MMTQLDDLNLFVMTVRHQGISAAAKAAGMPRSRVSRRLQELEKALGCQLLIRTTRHIELTENGRMLFDQTQASLNTLNTAMSRLQQRRMQMEGPLRLAVPAAVASSPTFISMMQQYIERFPRVNLEVFYHQHSVDLQRQNIDIQLLPSESEVINLDYVRQTLLPFPCCWAASPAYLSKHGRPQDEGELKQHSLIASRHIAAVLQQDLSFRLRSDDLHIVQQLTAQGMGIGLLPEVFVRRTQPEFQLERLFGDRLAMEMGLSLIYSSRTFLPEKTRKMIDLIRDTFIQLNQQS
ncbi:DNA-binding transcriptional regulator, LysR family [Ferrimonas sediminum]|uniref:DNA-binding transcriptional regulator, LysR family n=1 Tax=Ferrimonas sediminum TaxID=718193 RepID=A0A1G8RZ44_9GAMM|nr:LysR family transcriptional regulator [Ferrimonas sediminum]SDJ21690.1 DNA-binding transcriptional regulator, LysR family [Ferrimonas sediminum]